MAEKKQKKNDLRTRYTQQILKEHLVLLLNAKPIEKITVKELCESANINRATFYSHYDDMYDLMQQIKDQMMEYIIRHVKSNFGIRNEEMRDSLVEFLRYLRKNKYLYLLLCEESGAKSQREQTWEIVKEYRMGDRSQHTPCWDFKDEFLLIYTTYGTTAVIESWLRNDMPITEEELSDILIQLMIQL